MWNTIKNALNLSNSEVSVEYIDVAEEILKYADMIENGSLTIEGFTNHWNNRRFKSNLFASSMELSLMEKEISHLLELHFVCVGHSPEYFSQRLRDIVFQFGSGEV